MLLVRADREGGQRDSQKLLVDAQERLRSGAHHRVRDALIFQIKDNVFDMSQLFARLVANIHSDKTACLVVFGGRSFGSFGVGGGRGAGDFRGSRIVCLRFRHVGQS